MRRNTHYIGIRERIEKRFARPSGKRLFDVTPFEIETSELQELQSIEQIESSNSVYDPMGAVSDLPFGHLNPRWQMFKTNIQSGDVIRRFETGRMEGTPRVALMGGYALVRNGVVVTHFSAHHRMNRVTSGDV